MKKNKSAYITLMTVIAISAVSIAVVLSLIFTSISMIKSGLSLNKLAQSQASAEACVEQALEEIRSDEDYNSSFILDEENYYCQVEVIKNSSENFTIQSTGQADNSLYRLLVEIDQIYPTINITTWKQMTDF